MKNLLLDTVEANPIIAAIKSDGDLDAVLELSDIRVIFVLYGDICTIGSIIEKLKNAGRMVMVHIDLIAGLGSHETAVDHIKNTTGVDGIITTKQKMAKRAKELGLYTIQRFFMIDSMAFSNIEKSLSQVRPDMIELLPGVIPKIIKRVCESAIVPVIAGGLISDKEDIVNALNAGAIAVSSTNHSIWRE